MESNKSITRAGPDARQSGRLVPLLLLALGVLLTYLEVFKYPYFISEYAQFYHDNSNLTLAGWLENYNPMRPGWFRPSAFILQYQIVAGVVGWHNIFAFQCVALLTLIGLAVSVYFLTAKLLGDLRVAVFAGLASVIHPVMYMLPADLIYFDAMYQIALVWALYFFIKSFEGNAWKNLVWTGCLYLFALTCKEQSFVFPGVLVVFIGLRLFIMMQLREWKLLRPQILTAVVMCFVGCAFAFMRSVAMGNVNGDYRSTIDWAQIIPNAVAGVTWIFRLFPWGTPSWDGIPGDIWAAHNSVLFSRLCGELFSVHGMWHPVSAIVGLLIVAVCIWGSIHILRVGSKYEKWVLGSLWASILVLIALPICSGGRPWHFAMPEIVVMILLSWGLLHLLSKPRPSFVLKGLVIVACFLMVLSMYDFSKARMSRFSMNYVNVDALARCPVSSARIPHGAKIYYVTGPEYWAYGNGYLFEWIYMRPDIVDVHLSSNADMSLECAKSVAEGRDLMFHYDVQKRVWTDESGAVTRYYNESSKDARSLDFSANGNGTMYLASGWSSPEPSGTWTQGSRAELKVSWPPSHAAKLNLWMYPYTPSMHPRQPVNVLVNGAVVARIVYDRNTPVPEPLTIDLPEEVMKRGVQSVAFEISDPSSPALCGESGDARLLGVYIKRLELVLGSFSN
jgi:hypothetical protein